ncbi:lipid II:glycine glycyltransferase FemX [Agromyces sp. LHK192]|uniref:lipid II:glycine glycyltransferase FemX n=1 Tax=Agromyces sp. LHK192 TaxID=2498704 RepID=UPI000FD8CAE4|nr:GNAT family N-acetyltransferase [Agromyces sp. LHK192]
MSTTESVRLTVPQTWDARVLAEPGDPHFMQSSTWARVRSTGPWRVRAATADEGPPVSVLEFERDVAEVGALRHLPRISGIGPDEVEPLTAYVRETAAGAFATKVELYQHRDDDLDAAFRANGWLPTRASQYRHAVVVRLADGADAAFERMKKRGRAEIRTGERNGVVVERTDVSGADAEQMIDLVRTTEERSGAFFRDDEYLRRVWTAFADDGGGSLYLAKHGERVVAGAFVVRFGTHAWYKDGGSTRDLPQLMASRYLQWRIMQDLAQQGVHHYDLGHVPPPDHPHPAGRGILIFKSAFAPDLVEYQPAYLLAHTPAAEAWRLGESAFISRHRTETGDYWY